MMGQGHPAFIWIAYGALVLMNGVDLWYTEDAMRYGIEEANPFMSRIYQDFGMSGMGVVKGITLGIIFCVISLLKEYPVAERVFYLMVLVYTYMTFYHLWEYLERTRKISEVFT